MAWDFAAAVGVAVVSSGIWPAVLPKFLERKNRKKIEAQERKEHERDEWMQDSKDAYKRVAKECEGCRQELERVKKYELEPLKRDQAALREALIGRIEVIDELLPHINHLPPEKVRDLQRLNRAERIAAFRGNWG